MKKLLAYIAYYAFAIICTYIFQLILLLWILMYTAVDGLPIELSEKLSYSIGFPVIHFIILTIVFLIYRSILMGNRIEIKKLAPIVFNGVMTLYLMGLSMYDDIDLFLLFH